MCMFACDKLQMHETLSVRNVQSECVCDCVRACQLWGCLTASGRVRTCLFLDSLVE